MSHSNNATTTSVEPQDRLVDEHGNPLPLPAPPSAEEAQKLDLSSGQCTAKLDHLGPLVVNKDGTLSQIANWEQMSEKERSNTLRILGKRNQLRREALSAEEGEGVGSGEGR